MLSLISDKQKRMLAFIEKFVDKKGYPPTYEEIRVGMNISSKSLVNHHLEALEKAAFLSRVPNTSRGIRLINGGDTVRVPMINRDQLIDFAAIKSDEAIALTRDIVPNGSDLYALRAEGETFADAFIYDGDIVVIQPQTHANNGEMVVITLKDRQQITLKRFYRENGHVRLQPDHPNGETLLLDPETVTIQGKVITVIRQMG